MLLRRTFLSRLCFLAAGVVFPLPVRGAARIRGGLDLPYVRIDPDGTITLRVGQAEMGQGVWTSLPMLLAEELAVDLAGIRVETAPPGPRYRLAGAESQMTGSSDAVEGSWHLLRKAGAEVRERLLRAASTRLGVARSSLTAGSGRIVHAASGRSLGYGVLAAAAARLPRPRSVRPLPASLRRLVGTSPPRLDLPQKVDGTARYGVDVALPGMLHAAVRHLPEGILAGFSIGNLALPEGYRAVRVPGALAVVGPSWWKADRCLSRLDLPSPASPDRPREDPDPLLVLARAARQGPGLRYLTRGRKSEATGGVRIEAEYLAPFQAHATMEPQVAVAEVTSRGARLVAPTQAPEDLREAVAETLGLDPGKVRIEPTWLGGGFGRRFETDVGVQAAVASLAVGRPVRLAWNREEDLRNDFYRPAAAARLSARLGPGGSLLDWSGLLASGSVMDRVDPGSLEGGFDPTSVEGFEPPYACGRLELAWQRVPAPVRLGWWRSVAYSTSAFFVESFVDELATASGADPLAFRLSLLAEAPRLRRVLEAVAGLSGWPGRTEPGVAQGIALCASFGSAAAVVLEVASGAEGIVVPRAWVAIDCGRVVHPDTVIQQMEGSVVFGLTAAAMGSITVASGQVMESGFHDYPLLRLPATPRIEVAIVPSARDPSGVGEPGVPPVAPALANALARLTGTRHRSLPIPPGILALG